MKIKLLSLVLICTCIKPVIASDKLSFKQHSFGTQMAIGSANMPASNKSDDNGVLQLYGFTIIKLMN